jgi:hypothetical protein
MRRIKEASWWYWLATVGLLAAGLAGRAAGFQLAIVLCAVQVVHFALRRKSLTAFPVQVRAGYLGLLLAAQWPPLHFLYWVQLVGTSAMVAVDYCFLARMLSLLPWNRSEPISWHLAARRIFSPPVSGSILNQPVALASSVTPVPPRVRARRVVAQTARTMQTPASRNGCPCDL